MSAALNGGNIIVFPIRGNIRPITEHMADRAPHDQPGWFDIPEEDREMLIFYGSVVPMKDDASFLVDLLMSLGKWRTQVINPFIVGEINSDEQKVRLILYMLRHDCWPSKSERVARMKQIIANLGMSPPVQQWFDLDVDQQDLIYPFFNKNQPHKVSKLVERLQQRGWPKDKKELNSLALRLGLIL